MTHIQPFCGHMSKRTVVIDMLDESPSKQRSKQHLSPEVKRTESDSASDDSLGSHLQTRRMSTGSAMEDRKTSGIQDKSKQRLSMAVFPNDNRPKHTGSLSTAQGLKFIGVLNRSKENLHKSRSVSELFSAFKSGEDSLRKGGRREEKTKSRGFAFQELLNRFKN